MKTMEPHTPIQYIIGHTDFCDLEFVVDERVLIPRPETEMLVESAAELAFSFQLSAFSLNILDLCTGSGCVAVALANRLTHVPVLEPLASLGFGTVQGSAPPKEWNPVKREAAAARRWSFTKQAADFKIAASDISAGALEVARMNAARHGIADKIEFLASDLFNSISGRFDIIVSNPPYIARYEFAGLQREVLKEPRVALDGGQDGLDLYRRIAPEAPSHLKDGGYLIFEIGFGQARAVGEIIEQDGALEVMDIKVDRNNVQRVVIAKKICRISEEDRWID